jgi:hypothetical protein
MRAAALSGRSSAARWLLLAPGIVLLAGPTALAFFSGGYFDEARAWAGLAAWALVVLAVLLEPGALPRSRAAWLGLGGLAALGAWTLLSITWAPTRGSAYHAGQLAFLYVGALLVAAALLRNPRLRLAAEPALAAGALVVIGYGISERLLPGVLHFHRSLSAEGRLEQPLTYWNAMGALAALGFVLCARVAGDRTRRVLLRAAAAGAGAPLGMGLYLSFSRGALFACAAGLVALIVAAARTEQLRGLLTVVVAGGLAAAAVAPLRGLTALAGSETTREGQGAIALAALVVIVILAVTTQWWIARREQGSALRLPRRARLIALAVICAGLGLAIAVGAKEGTRRPLSGGATRLVRLQSNRYDYWRVAVRAFRAEPVHGVGAGGWAVWWLRYRDIDDFAQDAHSLPLQTLAELGLVGLALLLAFLGGIALAARDAHRADPAPAAGPIAGFVVWVAHAPLDWDWQMPAVTLVAMVLGGALLATAPRRCAAPRD